ncbi:hypothetical protein B0T19DRAFT_441023 [Cercophora scortea]|uniref:Ankyrin repeat protein n=1 Tax=Cercophora scortea TaxID=314031 RepID=A0AAE0IKU3_9PEZI|nr:hypothetical protein B0T19DRAFT_441023 [Cercophora scortea]
MPCRVPDTAQSIAFALKGNIDGLKDLFSRRLASPRDWALYGGMHQYETVHFLISQGALVDDESYENVFDFVFRNKCSNTEMVALKCIRDSRDNNWIEEQHFSLLHEIILHLSSRSLADALEEDPGAVHTPDAQGRTALDWATARAQLDNMKFLIAHGSSVNNMDARGRTGSAACTRALVDAGADPNLADHSAETPLHCA